MLLILLTGNTILNAPESSSQSSSSSSTSETSSSGSSTTSSSSSSSSTSSSSVYEGNSLPTWDFSNPTIHAVGAGQGLAYDQPGFSRYQGDFYYQSGLNYLDLGDGNEPEARLMEIGFSVYNVRTQKIIFAYTFSVSDTFKERMIGDPEGQTSSGYISSIAYDQEDTLYVLFHFIPVFKHMDNTSIADGDYAPLVSYIQDKDASTNVNKFQMFLLSFDVNTPEAYTILDGQESEEPKGIVYTDLLFNTNTLYITSHTYNASLVNTPTDPRYLSDLLPFPTHDNQLTLEADFIGGSSYSVSYVHRLAVDNTNALTFMDSSLVTFNTLTYLSFASYQEGLTHRFFNDQGKVLLKAEAYAQQEEGIAATTPLNDYDSSFLGASQTAIYDALNPMLVELATYVNDLYGSYPFMNLVAIFQGFLDMESNVMEDVLISGFASRSDGDQQMFHNAITTQNRFIDEEGNTFIIENTTFESRPWGSLRTPTIDYIHAESSLLKVDALTLATTTVLSYSSNGPILSGIYASETGYYLTGNLYSTEATPTVDNIDAFLYQLDTDFNITDELVLSGSGFDITSSIGFNAQGQPSWFVMSNSIDGDFVDFALSNPSEQYVHYSITF